MSTMIITTVYGNTIKLGLLCFFPGMPIGAITAKKDLWNMRSINSGLMYERQNKAKRIRAADRSENIELLLPLEHDGCNRHDASPLAL